MKCRCHKHGDVLGYSYEVLIICVVGRVVVRATFAADLAVVEKPTREQQPGHLEPGKGESVDHLNAFS